GVQNRLDGLNDLRATPEGLCGACPVLLPVVRARWQQMCRLRADLDALFPPPTETAPYLPAPPWQGMALPRVPGYEVEAVLGRGGTGGVLRARDPCPKRP